MELVLTENVGTLAKILCDKAKKEDVFDALGIDYKHVGWSKDFKEEASPMMTRSGTSTRNFQAMADAVFCITEALKEGCYVSHDNFITEDYMVINGRRRLNNIKNNEL